MHPTQTLIPKPLASGSAMQALIERFATRKRTSSMPTRKDAKSMAKTLRTALAQQHIRLAYGTCLEIVARQFGFADWNTLSARLPSGEEALAPKQPRCSFCGKAPGEIRALVEGGCSRASLSATCVFICDECSAFAATVTAGALDTADRISHPP